MAHTATASTTPWAPWKILFHWSPFKIDALGLVTLLGAEEINAAVGRLVSSAYLEYLPLLGAYVIAGDRFTEKAAGWNLYNISQGIHTTDLAAWLTRWMLSQEFEMTRNFVVWEVTPPKSRKNEIFISFLIGFVFNGFLIAGTILSKDWYGFANALAMVISIIVRVYIIGQQRLAVDAMVDEAVGKSGPPKDTYEALRSEYQSRKKENKAQLRNRNVNAEAAEEEQEDLSSRSNSSSPSDGAKQAVQEVKDTTPPTKPNPKKYKEEIWTGKATKVLIIQSDSKAVTFWMPNEFLIPPSVFIEGPIILNPKTYFVMRSIGWFAFAVHIIAIGMADLASQLYTVALIVLPTILLIQKTGCDDSEWMTTFSSWKKSIFHNHSKRNQSAKKSKSGESANSAKFKKVRECWIGSRLKAEIYEWPKIYEFREEKDGNGKHWVGGGPPKGQERSKKRQDLYAWLALNRDEENSMDKWDLFPHIREGNTSWWKTYKNKKHALKVRLGMGPQYVAEPPPSETGTQSSQEQNAELFYDLNRTATLNFLPGQPQTAAQKPEPRHSISLQAASSAFPASCAHDLEDVAAVSKTDDNKAPAPPSNATSSVGAAPSPPPVNTSAATVGGPQMEPSAVFTQSPTATTATNEQP